MPFGHKLGVLHLHFPVRERPGISVNRVATCLGVATCKYSSVSGGGRWRGFGAACLPGPSNPTDASRPARCRGPVAALPRRLFLSRGCPWRRPANVITSAPPRETLDAANPIALGPVSLMTGRQLACRRGRECQRASGDGQVWPEREQSITMVPDRRGNRRQGFETSHSELAFRKSL
jgi:hypothetical protein